MQVCAESCESSDEVWVAGSDLTVFTNAERQIYREVEEDIKKEEDGRRDEW